MKKKKNHKNIFIFHKNGLQKIKPGSTPGKAKIKKQKIFQYYNLFTCSLLRKYAEKPYMDKNISLKDFVKS